MANNYKLTDEIRRFIIEKKKSQPELSCRALIPLIKEHFQANLSKSLINTVIKENNLSNPKGRKRIKELLIPQPFSEIHIEPQIKPQAVEKKPGIIENGGCFFLKVAELKLNLSFRLAENIHLYLPNLSTFQLQEMIEALIYTPIFKDMESLGMLLGRDMLPENLMQYAQALASIPLSQLKEPLVKLSLIHNINEINELYKQCLLRLNSYVVTFFPPEYQFLDFHEMQKRFYSLPAEAEREKGLLSIQLFYPEKFFWLNDIIWQEGFSYAANKVNESKILTRDGQQIWINPQPQFLPENASFFA